MNEFLLHYIWKYQLYNTSGLRTTSGEELRILKAGEHNTNAGPDFFNARIKCNDLVLAGNIEVHLNSSDWKKHEHQRDKAYQNVILHIVYHDDAPVISTAKERILTLELRNRIPRIVIERYEDLQQLQAFIPCQQHWPSVDKFTRDTWMHRLLIERLEQKCDALQTLLDESAGDWEYAFYIALARNFGFKINAVPFELVARAIPPGVIAKNRPSRAKLEALLFGVAGYLQDHRIRNKYYKDLRAEFQYQKEKYNLQIIDISLWKMLRLRPANFPQLRLAQFAALLHKGANIPGNIIEKKDISEIKLMFQAEIAQFWDSHYSFRNAGADKQGHAKAASRAVSASQKHLGDDAIENIMINTIAPFLFLYGRNRFRQDLQDFALELFEAVSPEKNKVISGFEALGTEIKSAAETQALLQLKKHYCDARRCLECAIGLKILKQ
jgi:hypothetical protein